MNITSATAFLPCSSY